MHEWRGETTQDSLHRAHQEHIAGATITQSTFRKLIGVKLVVIGLDHSACVTLGRHQMVSANSCLSERQWSSMQSVARKEG